MQKIKGAKKKPRTPARESCEHKKTLSFDDLQAELDKLKNRRNSKGACDVEDYVMKGKIHAQVDVCIEKASRLGSDEMEKDPNSAYKIYMFLYALRQKIGDFRIQKKYVSHRDDLIAKCGEVMAGYSPAAMYSLFDKMLSSPDDLTLKNLHDFSNDSARLGLPYNGLSLRLVPVLNELADTRCDDIKDAAQALIAEYDREVEKTDEAAKKEQQREQQRQETCADLEKAAEKEACQNGPRSMQQGKQKKSAMKKEANIKKAQKPASPIAESDPGRPVSAARGSGLVSQAQGSNGNPTRAAFSGEESDEDASSDDGVGGEREISDVIISCLCQLVDPQLGRETRINLLKKLYEFIKQEANSNLVEAVGFRPAPAVESICTMVGVFNRNQFPRICTFMQKYVNSIAPPDDVGRFFDYLDEVVILYDLLPSVSSVIESHGVYPQPRVKGMLAVINVFKQNYSKLFSGADEDPSKTKIQLFNEIRLELVREKSERATLKQGRAESGIKRTEKIKEISLLVKRRPIVDANFPVEINDILQNALRLFFNRDCLSGLIVDTERTGSQKGVMRMGADTGRPSSDIDCYVIMAGGTNMSEYFSPNKDVGELYSSLDSEQIILFSKSGAIPGKDVVNLKGYCGTRFGCVALDFTFGVSMPAETCEKDGYDEGDFLHVLKKLFKNRGDAGVRGEWYEVLDSMDMSEQGQGNSLTDYRICSFLCSRNEDFFNSPCAISHYLGVPGDGAPVEQSAKVEYCDAALKKYSDIIKLMLQGDLKCDRMEPGLARDVFGRYNFDNQVIKGLIRYGSVSLMLAIARATYAYDNIQPSQEIDIIYRLWTDMNSLLARHPSPTARFFPSGAGFANNPAGSGAYGSCGGASALNSRSGRVGF